MGFLTAPNSKGRRVWSKGDLIAQRKPTGSAPPLPAPITGTPPSLAPLRDGDTLDSAATWGTYSGTGTVTAQRQARLNGGSWNLGNSVLVTSARRRAK
jgi:hypothetical protein